MARKTKVKIKVRDEDRGWKKLRRTIFGARMQVTVGVHGEQDARGDGNIGNVELMAVHEFGSERAGVPERSVIRLTVDEQLRDYRRIMVALGGKIYVNEMTERNALEVLGLKVAADMRRTIDRTPGQWDALQPATIASRQFGGTKPLLDRGELKKSLRHRVGFK